MNTTEPDIIENLQLVMPTAPHDWVAWTVFPTAALLAVGAGAWMFCRKRRRSLLAAPSMPPDVTALAALAATRPLLEQGDCRGFVIAVSDVLRAYIEGRFALEAPRLSTEEFLLFAEQSDALDEARRLRVAGFLAECDNVKFALHGLERPSLDALYACAETFILETRESSGAAPGTLAA